VAAPLFLLKVQIDMTPLEAAIAWIQKGGSPAPVPHRSKRPVLQGWEQLEITIDLAPRYFNGTSQNIGVLLGDKYGSADVDCDCPEAIVAARELLPETGLIFGRQSKPFSNFFYRSDPPVRTVQFIDPLDHSTLVELRGSSSDGSVGLQTVVPPSIHESGELVRFESGFEGTPANVDAEVLTSAVRRVAGHRAPCAPLAYERIAASCVLGSGWRACARRMEHRRRQGVSPRAIPVSLAG